MPNQKVHIDLAGVYATIINNTGADTLQTAIQCSHLAVDLLTGNENGVHDANAKSNGIHLIAFA